MMRKFAAMVLALALFGPAAFFGCADDPSEEQGADGRAALAATGIPMTMNPSTNELAIGDGSGGFIGNFYDSLGAGHTVEIINGSTTTNNGGRCIEDGYGSQCWIRIKNLDSDEYMANVFVAIFECDACDLGVGGNHQMDNFDASWPEDFVDYGIFVNGTINVTDAYTVHPNTKYDGTNSGAPTQLLGRGIAYVTDTANPEAVVWPMNPFGARMRDLPTTANAKPEWMISPACGTYSEMWDFGGTSSAQFFFFATIKATWFQINPFGGTDNGNNASSYANDPRFDFQNFATFFLTITDLVALHIDSAYRKFYRPGTVYRSNVLSGYKPSWARGVGGKTIADIDYTGGQKYFAVNVGLEASDRLESQNFGLKSDPYHEYYNTIGVLISYNPRVLQEIRTGATWLLTKDGGTRFQPRAQSPCVLQEECGGGINFWDHANTPRYMDMQIDATETSVSSGDDKGGYIAVWTENVVYTYSGYWSYFTSAEYYTSYDLKTETSNQMTGAPEGEIPKTFFFRGFAKLTRMTDNASCVTQDGPDPEPEYWLYNFILKVQGTCPGPSCNIGLGSEIKVDTFSTYTYIEMFNTGSGFDQSGGALLPSTDAGPNSADDRVPYYIYDGATLVVGSAPIQEVSNKKIRHRGPSISESNRGTFQAWNAAVCIK